MRSKVHSLDRDGDEDESIQVIGDEPIPEIVLIMGVLSDSSHLGVGQLQEIAVAKLEGFSNAEIAERFECPERTIERHRSMQIFTEIAQDVAHT